MLVLGKTDTAFELESRVESSRGAVIIQAGKLASERLPRFRLEDELLLACTCVSSLTTRDKEHTQIYGCRAFFAVASAAKRASLPARKTGIMRFSELKFMKVVYGAGQSR